MTDRIYTIPALGVVAGMLYHTTDNRWQRVLRAERVNNRVRVEHDGPGVICVHARCTLPIGLSGPSPRELLCTCIPDVTLRAKFEHFQHDSDCPVRRLRLRLWPVGATWDDHSQDGTGALGLYVLNYDDAMYGVAPSSLNEWLERQADHRVRAAFCEPEVTP